MKVELVKEDLLRLLRGIEPAPCVYNIVKDYGTLYNGSVWNWNINIVSTFEETKLWYLYNLCKDSWK